MGGQISSFGSGSSPGDFTQRRFEPNASFCGFTAFAFISGYIISRAYPCPGTQVVLIGELIHIRPYEKRGQSKKMKKMKKSEKTKTRGSGILFAGNIRIKNEKRKKSV
jgi:hypothetical protein